MRNFLIGVIAIVLLGYFGGFTAWWGVALVALIVGFALPMHGGLSFSAGALGGSLFFGIYAMVLDSANASILSSKINQVFPFDTFVATVAIGALLGALGMISGKYLRDVVLGEPQKGKHRNRYR